LNSDREDKRKMKLYEVPTPSYVVDLVKLEENLKILRKVADESGAKILLAQKAFSMFSVYPLIRKYLDGSTASGLYEARLAYEEMGGEVHVFSPAFKESEFDEILKVSDHIVFNSFNQLLKFKDKCKGKEIGLRINPECSTQKDHAIYDPCAFGSRLGVTLENFREDLIDDISGLHFHTLCEQNSDDLELTIAAVEEKFGKYLKNMKWLNMGGGHHISRKDYDTDRLIRIIKHIREKYDVKVFLEPGEAVALNAGYLVTEVLDIVENGIKTLILDASAACHMPDVLEMPYRPPLKDSFPANEKEFTYRLSSATCLSGDIIGDYSFEKEIKIGDKLYFEDMAIYSMVKNNTFNGIALPNIMTVNAEGECELVKSFSYEDFKGRLS
jgi:carboxynorspermidine decarboxylase